MKPAYGPSRDDSLTFPLEMEIKIYRSTHAETFLMIGCFPFTGQHKLDIISPDSIEQGE
jgi:hypothetical protein